MLPTFTMTRPRQPSAVLKWEADAEVSRGSGILLAGNTCDVGTVLGKITASGKLVPLDPSASDGSQTFYAVALMAVDATAADVDGVLYVRRLAKLSVSGLLWGAGVDATEQAAALAQAEAQFVIVGNF